VDTLELLQGIAQIVYYIALSITGPLALITFLRAKKSEEREREYKVFDELDNKFLEYQKLALQHDLDLIDVPDAHPLLEGDRLRKKQELVACTLAFTLFQRAYLMFHHQSDGFKRRQWEGWERFLDQFVRRRGAQGTWSVCRSHLDSGFRRFVDGRVAVALEEAGAEPATVYAFRRTGLLVRDENEHALRRPTGPPGRPLARSTKPARRVDSLLPGLPVELVQPVQAFLARNRRGVLRGDALHLRPVGGLLVAGVAQDHALRVEGVEVPFLSAVL
jgi:hypothetical protein